MKLRWGLIVSLAVFGLVRPLLSIFGVYENFEGPWAPVLVTALIAAVWVSAVVIRRVSNPLVTLILVGGLYGVFAILLQQIIWNFFLESAPASVPTIGYVGIVVTNVIWGAF